MARRTIYLSDSVEALIRANARAGESFSAAATRLVEAGAQRTSGKRRPAYVGSGEGPDDLGERAKEYLRQLVTLR